MENPELNFVKEYNAGKLFETNGALIPVLSGSTIEMGEQYGALMTEEMQNTFNLLVQPEIEAKTIDNTTIDQWIDRAYTTGSLRTKQFYEGIALGSSWPLRKVILLDQIYEYRLYKSKLESFAGCTSIVSFGKESIDGKMYVGRNLNWNPILNALPLVLTIRKPIDGSYKLGSIGWSGIYNSLTALNEKGVYMDIHDGSSMGGTIVATERPPILNTVVDILSEVNSSDEVKTKFNGLLSSISIILTVADTNTVLSIECSSLAGNRVKHTADDSLVIANTFTNDDWGIGRRETVSHSLQRFTNIANHLKENRGKIDVGLMKELMDLKLFNEDHSLMKNGGCTKPQLIDGDITNYQIVCDVSNLLLWVKMPEPEFYTKWTPISLKELFA
ncbi:C45 family autoproteolytic acyltransferase/hydolase [Flammeovirga sp. SubArs3]|uniref:C45 family autoproteolytic acyltransferase/hydolase n=1 Tax=Flammeovirga sp. SubArs3 TaxID=2995316 RepID=UPI00248B760B|nr:C45 family autoproteolytic acyltransferase/hydolase [Flammeovirga sp. SubArs3]